MDHAPPAPRPHLALAPAMLVALGMIMSTDVLKTAPTVAQNVAPGLFVWLWIGGGLVSLVGALCYVEMACAFPDAGGEYSFLSRAWGPRVGALYAWSRFAVLHTGWIALMAHLLADYASALVPMDAAMRTVFALMVVALLALINCAHVRIGFLTQALMVALVALGFAAVIAAGFVAAPAHAQTLAIPAGDRQIGVALIYVFLAFGGWSDIATLSAELRGGPRGMAIVTVGAIVLLMALYIALNQGMAQGLGLGALARSTAPGADVARAAFGPAGAVLVVLVVVISAVASINSTLIVGARITWAAAQTIPVLHPIGQWHAGRGTPVAAVIAVAGFSGVLTVLAGMTGNGFGAMVDYMSPVYWVFILLGMGAAVRLRRGAAGHRFPVRTPLFPLFPVVFGGVALIMLWWSLTELGRGALVGAGVMALGLVLERLAGRST
ncbi:APC family permease [Novosphingobium acidiphilum]|uniref:APC family permease n=1 Tax=Novosphingobium acidiphilum TaxID=505248 RepID=UPI0003F79A78|nr:APC family permease [Novosphingobium acidiphilum]